MPTLEELRADIQREILALLPSMGDEELLDRAKACMDTLAATDDEIAFNTFDSVPELIAAGLDPAEVERTIAGGVLSILANEAHLRGLADEFRRASYNLGNELAKAILAQSDGLASGLCPLVPDEAQQELRAELLALTITWANLLCGAREENGRSGVHGGALLSKVVRLLHPEDESSADHLRRLGNELKIYPEAMSQLHSGGRRFIMGHAGDTLTLLVKALKIKGRMPLSATEALAQDPRALEAINAVGNRVITAPFIEDEG